MCNVYGKVVEEDLAVDVESSMAGVVQKVTP